MSNKTRIKTNIKLTDVNKISREQCKFTKNNES